MERASVLVTGATGAQGGAVAQALLRAGAPVSALVRDPGSPQSLALKTAGASLVRGDLDDAASLVAATRNAAAVFSVQLYNPANPSAERRQALNLIRAARENRVPRFIQSSVSGVGAYAATSGWGDERWDRTYWENKLSIEEATRGAGFSYTLILRPAFMMDNFAPPKVARMFPDLAHHVLRSAISPDTKIALVAAADIGAVAALALEEAPPPSDLELAGDVLTTAEIASTLSDAWGVSVRAETLTADEAIAAGQSPGWVRSQEWLNEVGYPARPETISKLSLAPTRLAGWAREHRP